MENSLLLDVLDVSHGVSVGVSQNPVWLSSRHRVGDVGVEVDVHYINDAYIWEVDAFTKQDKQHPRIAGYNDHPFVDVADLDSGFVGFSEASVVASGQPPLYVVEHKIAGSLLSVIYGRDTRGFVFQVRLIDGEYEEPLLRAHIFNVLSQAKCRG